MLRHLAIWIMLIVLPLQSYAAVCTFHGMPMHQAMQTIAPAHADVAPAYVQHAEHCDMAMAADGDDSADQSSQPYKDPGKCSACSVCCMCAMAVFTSPGNGLSSAGAAIMTPHPVAALTSVSLAAQRRPPRLS